MSAGPATHRPATRTPRPTRTAARIPVHRRRSRRDQRPRLRPAAHPAVRVRRGEPGPRRSGAAELRRQPVRGQPLPAQLRGLQPVRRGADQPSAGHAGHGAGHHQHRAGLELRDRRVSGDRRHRAGPQGAERDRRASPARYAGRAMASAGIITGTIGVVLGAWSIVIFVLAGISRGVQLTSPPPVDEPAPDSGTRSRRNPPTIWSSPSTRSAPVGSG